MTEPKKWAVIDADGRIPDLPGSFRGAFDRREDAETAAANRPGSCVSEVIDVSTIIDETGQYWVRDDGQRGGRIIVGKWPEPPKE